MAPDRLSIGIDRVQVDAAIAADADAIVRRMDPVDVGDVHRAATALADALDRYERRLARQGRCSRISSARSASRGCGCRRNRLCWSPRPIGSACALPPMLLARADPLGSQAPPPGGRQDPVARAPGGVDQAGGPGALPGRRSGTGGGHPGRPAIPDDLRSRTSCDPGRAVGKAVFPPVGPGPDARSDAGRDRGRRIRRGSRAGRGCRTRRGSRPWGWSRAGRGGQPRIGRAGLARPGGRTSRSCHYRRRRRSSISATSVLARTAASAGAIPDARSAT